MQADFRGCICVIKMYTGVIRCIPNETDTQLYILADVWLLSISRKKTPSQAGSDIGGRCRLPNFDYTYYYKIFLAYFTPRDTTILDIASSRSVRDDISAISRIRNSV